jgi:phosphohistidine phosphatase SixA
MFLFALAIPFFFDLCPRPVSAATAPLAAPAQIMKCRTVIVVRHAEKEERLGEGDSVPLTPNGVRMAEALAKKLANEPISKIFVSLARRTQQTAEPVQKMLSKRKQPFVIFAKLSSPETLLQSDIQTVNQNVEPDDVVLVISHRSKISEMLNALNIKVDENIPYEKMWILTPNGGVLKSTVDDYLKE